MNATCDSLAVMCKCLLLVPCLMSKQISIDCIKHGSQFPILLWIPSKLTLLLVQARIHFIWVIIYLFMFLMNVDCFQEFCIFTAGYRWSYEAGKKMLLSLLFSRSHGLCDCVDYFADCARCGDWITFLLFAELYQCQPSQVGLFLNCSSKKKSHAMDVV